MTNKERTSITERLDAMMDIIATHVHDMTKRFDDAHTGFWGGKQDGVNSVWKLVNEKAKRLHDRIDAILTEAELYLHSAEEREDARNAHYWKGKVAGIKSAWKVIKAQAR